ncbi:MAG TPA: hypothetical protein VK907_04460 [Phnomibacter sp.]|nr:hypothetical protein [Phnomibacter sp.]
MKNYLLYLCTFLLAFSIQPSFSQKGRTTAAVQEPAIENAVFKNLQYRLVGPFRGGRSAAVSGSHTSKNVFYFGATGGGVWKTIDGGSNWKNVSDGFFGSSIGSVAVAPSDETIVYAGEGEKTMRGNVSEGLGGMWRSDDGGKNWTNLGLKDGRHIVRIVIHPKNPDMVWVAVMGHLFGPNKERGVYKTTDGGKTWKQTLYVNDQTGAFEVVMEPGNPRVLYASTWRVIRQPHTLESGGEGSALWKSTDGGDTWTNISGNKGLPRGTWGINAVAVAPSNTDKVYAIIENEKGGLYASEDGGKTWSLRSSDNNIRQRAWYYTRVFVDPQNENTVYCPNVGFMVSRDGGRSFTSLRTPHSDHHDLWIDPADGRRMIVADDGGAQVSFDAGQNWSTMMNQPTAQIYRVSADNAFPYRIMSGQQDNSAFRIRSRTYGAAITNNDMDNTAGSESGYVVADPLDPEITYGGNYMGLLERLNHKTGESRMINIWPIDNMGAGAEAARYRFQWNFPIFFSPHNPKRLYAAGNHLFVTENEGRSWERISPDLTTNDKSKQGPSGGPITKDNTSVEYYCTIFTAAESPLEKDLLWAGSDDGLIHVSRDGGKNWENVTPAGLPPAIMWNRVEVDPFKKGAAYFAGTRYKSDDFSPFLYKTEDYGKTWKRIDNGINRLHFTRTICADPKRQGLLYAGTEFGMYISYNDGANWMPFQLNLPIVPITELLIKNNDLIVATQGRSFWILDDLSVVQQYEASQAAKNFHAYTPDAAYRMQAAGRGFRGAGGTMANAGANPSPGVNIPLWLKAVNDSTKVSMTVLDKAGNEIKTYSTSAKERELKLELNEGLNFLNWDMYYPEGERPAEGLILWNRARMMPMAPPGAYKARIRVEKDSVDIPLQLLADPNYPITQNEYDAQFNFLVKARDKFSETMKAMQNIADLKKQMSDFTGRLGKDCPKDIKDMTENIAKQLTAIENELHQTKAKSGQDVLNYPIKLDDKLSSVYRVASVGNGAPTLQTLEAYNVVAAQIDEQLNKLKAIGDNDVPKLNALIREKNLPVITPKK